ncbi:murein transglycosylase A [Roseomonas marmotae]|uniref:peptidoglycan lytic exotransglycosylase n=1 Tax=Roseomonas marmotae TaxID=2768161 RepID=A0ABS3KCE4_9PROT|nr:MltA domain-containing protein [Roseomonas marmotae]MBO1075124.1 MltA domain-containing protein [Roseomonas marmotae]QTI79762.1 MltA domain-containing protein [Roseomonas marmotae]
MIRPALAAALLWGLAACTPPPPQHPAELPGWADDRLAEALPPFLAGCRPPALPAALCAEAAGLPPGDHAAARAFFERNFTLRRAGEGLMTGYYEPEIRGATAPSAAYPIPLHTRPADLVEVDLGRFAPDLMGRRIAGLVRGGRLEPYPDRAAIEAQDRPALLWLADPVDRFFLQIQGSGRILLPDGSISRVGFDGQNGRPYVPIGRVLVQKNEIPRDKVSMQSIRAWLEAAGSERARAVMDQNPSYVFFRDVPARADQGPTGAQGVPLSPLRSIAVDRTEIPLGSPVWIVTHHPLTRQPLRRLVLAQDTGGAIRGPARADLFWGWGDEAAAAAGPMQEKAELFVLVPRAE